LIEWLHFLLFWTTHCDLVAYSDAGFVTNLSRERTTISTDRYIYVYYNLCH